MPGGVGALIEEMAKLIAKRKAVLQNPAHIEYFAKKYGLSPELTREYMEKDLTLTIKRHKAA